MARIGYARVSTLDQDHTTQVERLESAQCEKIFSEKRSGTTKKGRDELSRCLDFIRSADSLVITKIDRLARSARDLHNIVYNLEQQGITLIVLDQKIDTRTPVGKAFLGMLATFAEFETNIRKERQLEGIEKAKKEGKYKGRKPTARAKSDEVIKKLASGASKTDVAKEVGISIASVYRIINDQDKHKPQKKIF